MKSLVLFLFLSFLLACQNDNNTTQKEENTLALTNNWGIKYAKGFTINKYKGYKILTLKNAWVGESKSYQYVLYHNKKPKGIKNAIFVKTPIKSIACMSLTHVAFIEKLEQENSIVALSGCDYVSSPKINKKIANHSIKEIGQDQSINYEMLVEQSPAVIMAFGVDASSNSYINKMQTLGLTVVLNAEYMENHPLGKAEWIKFIAAFYELDNKADSIFKSTETTYLDLLKMMKNIKNKPTVFTGMPYNGAWYVPGGKSYQAQLFKDAGATYLWLNNDEKSSLVKSKEIIIDVAFDAAYWLNQDSYRNIASIVAFDEKFKGFKSVKEKHLYNNDKRINTNNGNDYWETGVVNPDIVLKDLIQVFHPELMEHELYYYRKLE